MKKLLLIILFALMMTGCIVYPGYDGYYDSGYSSYPYGYVSPNVNFYFHGGHGFHHRGHGGGGWRH
jgi:hypothetical protein